MNRHDTAPSHPVPLAAEGGALRAAASPSPAEGASGPMKPLPEDAVVILPVRNMVLFPGIVVPLTIGRERSLAAVQEAVRQGRPVGILLQSRPDLETPTPDELHWVGTTGNVLRYVAAQEGAHYAICKGQQRFRVLQFLEG
ncbi:MAG TPA: LON peptidase substrate-binding domain-containing protein, partial [Casimicrobiaceae bacterium]